ncbi:hypothetical protein MTR_7g113720 [Medicago truncatula]|uniref:Uncharacterized protein n=1 Tax=Medicago truncatula TaxID=3880 RepID=G7KZN3_MEDTR|nr:hypothetical protein MTR_7g113720 [Medicago truncatula]
MKVLEAAKMAAQMPCCNLDAYTRASNGKRDEKGFQFKKACRATEQAFLNDEEQRGPVLGTQVGQMGCWHNSNSQAWYAAENIGGVAENARNVSGNAKTLVAEDDGQVAQNAENVIVENVVAGNVAIQGQNVANGVANEGVLARRYDIRGPIISNEKPKQTPMRGPTPAQLCNI